MVVAIARPADVGGGACHIRGSQMVRNLTIDGSGEDHGIAFSCFGGSWTYAFNKNPVSVSAAKVVECCAVAITMNGIIVISNHAIFINGDVV